MTWKACRTGRQIQVRCGFGFQPRHLDFHPTLPVFYLNLERQNQLQVYRVNGGSIEPKALFTKNTLDHQDASKPAPGCTRCSAAAATGSWRSCGSTTSRRGRGTV